MKSITVLEGMVTVLNLSGNNLLVYAYISQNSPCRDSVEEIGRSVGISTAQTTRAILKTLERRGLITKEVRTGYPCVYSVVFHTPPQTKGKSFKEVVEDEIGLKRGELTGGINPVKELFKRRNGREVEDL